MTIPLNDEVFRIEIRKSLSDDIVNYIIYKNIWSHHFGLDETPISHYDSTRLGVNLDDLIRIARKYENKYWIIKDNKSNYIFEYLPELVEKYNKKD